MTCYVHSDKQTHVGWCSVLCFPKKFKSCFRCATDFHSRWEGGGAVATRVIGGNEKRTQSINVMLLYMGLTLRFSQRRRALHRTRPRTERLTRQEIRSWIKLQCVTSYLFSSSHIITEYQLKADQMDRTCSTYVNVKACKLVWTPEDRNWFGDVCVDDRIITPRGLSL